MAPVELRAVACASAAHDVAIQQIYARGSTARAIGGHPRLTPKRHCSCGSSLQPPRQLKTAHCIFYEPVDAPREDQAVHTAEGVPVKESCNYKSLIGRWHLCRKRGQHSLSKLPPLACMHTRSTGVDSPGARAKLCRVSAASDNATHKHGRRRLVKGEPSGLELSVGGDEQLAIHHPSIRKHPGTKKECLQLVCHDAADGNPCGSARGKEGKTPVQQGLHSIPAPAPPPPQYNASAAGATSVCSTTNPVQRERSKGHLPPSRCQASAAGAIAISMFHTTT